MPISYTTRRRPPPVRNAECRLQISDCGLRIMASMSGFGHWGLVIGTSGFPLSAFGFPTSAFGVVKSGRNPLRLPGAADFFCMDEPA